MTIIRTLLVSGVVVFSVACKDSVVSYDNERVGIATEHHGVGTGFSDHEVVGKSARRLSVDNLRRSIPLLFGGETWTVGQQDGFDVLARTLGEADYLEVTESNTEPNPLFAKFMDDMASQVCARSVRDDAENGTDHIVRHEDVYENLRYLRLKLHGIYVPPDSEEGLTDLKGVYDDIFGEIHNVYQSWFAVCVVMTTAPEFMSY